MPQIRPHAWIDGFKDAYAGHAARPVAEIDGFSYASGRACRRRLAMDEPLIECDGAVLGLESCADGYVGIRSLHCFDEKAASFGGEIDIPHRLVQRFAKKQVAQAREAAA